MPWVYGLVLANFAGGLVSCWLWRDEEDLGDQRPLSRSGSRWIVLFTAGAWLSRRIATDSRARALPSVDRRRGAPRGGRADLLSGCRSFRTERRPCTGPGDPPASAHGRSRSISRRSPPLARGERAARRCGRRHRGRGAVLGRAEGPSILTTSGAGSPSWRSAAGRRPPGRASTAAAGSRRTRRRCSSQEMAKLRVRPPLIGLRARDDRPPPHPGRQRDAEARAPAEDRARRDPLVPGLLRAGRGLGPRRRCRRAPCATATTSSLNGQKVWTSYGDKADWMFMPRPHRSPRQEARRHHLPAHATWRRPGVLGAADQADQRRVAVLRDLPHRRPRAASQNVVGQIERRLEHREDAARASSAT
mgnify:CR=1 FL=1